MADKQSSIHFEDVPLDQARMMGRGGPRMESELYHALKDKIQSLDHTATRMPLPEGIRLTTMKHRILRVAAALGMPVTIRKVPGGVIFWRSSEEDFQQAQGAASRLQPSRQQGKTAPQQQITCSSGG